MSGICDTIKSMPDDTSRLTTLAKPGFFDITGLATKLEADETIPGSTDGTIQYNEKINPNEIPYLNYIDLAPETGNILPIATASAAIRTGENSYVVFYPSYYNAASGQDGDADVQLTNGQANNVPLTGVPKNAEHKIPNVNFQGKTYTIYIIPTSTSMSGGAVQQGGSLDKAAAYTNLLNAQGDVSYSRAEVQAMLETAGDMPTVVPAVVPVVAPVFREVGNGELRHDILGRRMIEDNNFNLEQAKEHCKNLQDCIGFIHVDKNAQEARGETNPVPYTMYFSESNLPLQTRGDGPTEPKVYLRGDKDENILFATYSQKGFADIRARRGQQENNLPLEEAKLHCRGNHGCVGFIHVDVDTQIARGEANPVPFNIYITDEDIPLLKLPNDPKNAKLYVDDFYYNFKGGIIENIVNQTGGSSNTGIFLKKNKLNEIYKANIKSLSYRINYI